MAKSENQKIKLLKIYDILRMDSDKDHPIGTNALLKRLHEEGIQCERKALRSDIALLREYGYEVQITGEEVEKRPRENSYYIENRDLDIHAIRFLIDATQSAAFLSKAQTKEIVSSIAMLAGTYKAEVLKDNVLCFDKMKHSNDEVLKTVTELDRAIGQRKRVSFEYHLLGVNGKAEPRKKQDGQIKRYCAAPIAMAYHGGYYYLITYQEKYQEAVPYRIDRMKEVKVEEENFAPNQFESKFKSGELKNSMSAFGMWVGKTMNVTMRLKNEHAGDILDKFGEGTRLSPDGDGKFFVTVEVNPSDRVFVGWCMSYGNELEILSPAEAKKEVLRCAEEICAMYSVSKK